MKEENVMKTVVKLILIYYLLQILGSLVAAPCVMLLQFAATGTLDVAAAQAQVAAPAMLLGFVFIAVFVWKAGYLTDLRRMFSPVSAGWTVGAVLAGVSLIVWADFLVARLTFLPDWLEETFQTLQAGWLGVLCMAVLGPVLEEVFFRGVLTRELLKRYKPTTAILVSGLVFGIVHLNPAQVVGACISGFFFAWLYARTRSILPGMLIHILNNGLSVYLMRICPEVETVGELLGSTGYAVLLAVSAVVLILSMCWLLRQQNRFKPLEV